MAEGKARRGLRLGWHFFEFMSVFIGIVAAFGLNRWNEDRRDRIAEQKILGEIHKGLGQDLHDMEMNRKGHEAGIRAAQLFLGTLRGDTLPGDSLTHYYFTLFRGFISLQNISGYEVLKAKGFEVVRNDSLRSAIVHLYEYHYQFLQKLEEEYDEMKFHREYRHGLEQALAAAMQFDQRGKYTGMKQPLVFTPAQRTAILLELSMIKANRAFARQQYNEALAKAGAVRGMIAKELRP